MRNWDTELRNFVEETLQHNADGMCVNAILLFKPKQSVGPHFPFQSGRDIHVSIELTAITGFAGYNANLTRSRCLERRNQSRMPWPRLRRPWEQSTIVSYLRSLRKT